jgi:hypothetical protein
LVFGRPFLSSYGAGAHDQVRITSLRHLSTTIAFVKSSSKVFQVRYWKISWQRGSAAKFLSTFFVRRQETEEVERIYHIQLSPRERKILTGVPQASGFSYADGLGINRHLLQLNFISSQSTENNKGVFCTWLIRCLGCMEYRIPNENVTMPVIVPAPS